MIGQQDLSAAPCAETTPKSEAIVLDALPKLLAKIRIEQAYKIPRPTGGAKVLPLQRKSA